jgi:high-affinity iron transporter
MRPRSAVLAALFLAWATPGPARADERDAHRIISILDYVGADYGLAVKGGKIVSPEEYEEQIALVATARTLLASLRDPRALAVRPGVDADLAALAAAIRRVATPEEVAGVARRARAALVRGLDLVLIPTRPPSLERARDLYARACAECHGATGRADGPRSKELKPPPVSFHSPDRMENITPYRAFNAIGFGVPQTAMASFEDALSVDDRWSLAFYVVALRHEAAAGSEAPRVPQSTLAMSSDAELRQKLLALGVPPDRVSGALATLRARETFRPSDHERLLGVARRLLDEALAAFLRGHTETAGRHAIDAYLDGFDPLEVSLRMRDADLVRRVESAFADLRGAISRGDAGQVRARVADLRSQLREVEEVLVGMPGGATVAFLGGFLILFREGLEAALLIGALLGVLARLGRRDLVRWVHGGWIAAVVAGGATHAIAQLLLRVGAGNRETLEGVLSLLAAAVLFYVSYWLISKSDVQRWMAFLKAKVQKSVGRPGSLLAIAGISFLAVYREAFETVLFYQALLLDVRGEGWAVLGGTAAGAAALVAAVLAIFRLGRRLPLGGFFLASGLLLCLLAAVIGGKGIHALQAAGHLPWVPISFPYVDWLGLYPDAVSLSVQGAIVAALLGATLYALGRRRRAAA